MAALHRSLTSVPRGIMVLSVLALGATTSEAGGMHSGHGHSASGNPGSGGGHMGHPGGGYSSNMGHPGGGYANNNSFNSGFYYGYGVAAPYIYSPNLTGFGAGGFAPFLGPVFPQGTGQFGMGMGMGGGGLNLPMPPQGLGDPALLARPRRASNPARSKELVEIGDRSFRGKNIKRAEEKYILAVKADPKSPTPHVHLAQVSLMRGNYAAAADHLRDAVTVAADGAWLTNAPDIQAIFAEPADFARQLARLETHLQANPNDRDGWFVLGAETYLSGRTRPAFDVFQRLTDRRADEALTAFLDASRPRPAADAN